MDETGEIFFGSTVRKPELSFFGRMRDYRELKAVPYVLNHRTEVLAIALVLGLHLLIIPNMLIFLITAAYFILMASVKIPPPDPIALDDYWDMEGGTEGTTDNVIEVYKTEIHKKELAVQ